MKRDPETKALIRSIQQSEKADLAARLARIERALKRHGKKLAGYELTNLENALGPAVGRITMDAR